MTAARVLLVDDEQAFVETLSKRLNKRGLTVLAAFSGSEALQALDKEPNLDAVILDVKMPGMDGIETLRNIKTNHPLVEVIMLTGHATVGSAIDGMKLGAARLPYEALRPGRAPGQGQGGERQERQAPGENRGSPVR